MVVVKRIYPYMAKNMFRDRVEMLLAKRRPHTWGRQLGLSTGLIGRMARAGDPPGWKALLAIASAEHASITWLLSGAGTPYVVLPAHTDAWAGAQLARILQGSYTWRLTVAWGEPVSAVILDAPQKLQIDLDTSLSFRAIRVIAGHLGPLTVAQAVAAATHHRVRTVELSDEDLAEVAAGQVGTYGLFGDSEHAGLLAGAVPLSGDEVSELTARYDSGVSSEASLVRIYQAMGPEDRAKLLRVAEALAQAPDPEQ